jgi:hypothetical protein
VKEMPNQRFKEMSKSHDAVTTYAAVTEALGGETSDIMKTKFYNMKNYDAILGIVIAKTVVATHTLTFKMYEATDIDGGGSSAISGASTTYLSTQVTDAIQWMLEVDADQLTDGYDYVGMEASTDDADGSEAVSLVVIPTYSRYRQATTPA